MKITIYELLGKVKDKTDRNIYVKYFDKINKKEDIMWACKENIIYKLDQTIIALTDEVEILDDENEEKGLPEKINVWYQYNGIDDKELTEIMLKEIKDKINEIIDYLEKQRKGE